MTLTDRLRGIGRRPAQAEVVLVALLFAASAWWGARYVTAFVESGRQPSFYQHYFEPAVMLACGKGFTVADAPRPQVVDDFLFQRIDALDCRQLPPDLVVGTRDVYQYAWVYLMVTVGLAWTVLGVSWSGLTPLFGLLFGTVTVLAYAIFRVGVPRLPATAAALLLAGSSLHLQNLPHLRDYAKAPFVLALILILLWLVRRPLAPRALLALAALYGTILGIGYGFRTDLLANIPPFIVTMIVFLPGGMTRRLALKAGALALALVMFLLVSWPATSYVVQHGGCQWHAVLLGLSEPFNTNLGVTPSFYEWTPAYSDEFLHTAVNGYEYRMRGSEAIEYCSAAYDAASGELLRDIVGRFPADVVTRAHASVLRVLDLPFYWWAAPLAGVDGAQHSALGAALRIISGLASLSALLTGVLLGAYSARLGIFAVCVVLYFGGYPSMQFASRHFFHLEFIGWWAMAFLGWQAVRFWMPGHRAGLPATTDDWRRLAVRGATFAAIAGVVLLLPVPALRAYQHREADTLARTLLDAPRVVVPMVSTADGDGLTPLAGALADLGTDLRQVAYLDVHVDLTACPAGVPLGLRYDPAHAPFDFSGAVRAQPPGTVPARVLLPVFRYFQGFTLGGAPASCITRVDRLRSVQGLPLLPVLTLPDAWQSLPFHQRLRSPGWWLRLRAALMGPDVRG